MEPSLLQQVKDFVPQYQAVPAAKLSPATRVEEDLGATGDDAAQFLQAFAKRFEVDLTGIDFHKHFGPEGCNPLWLLYTPAWLQDHGKYPVTLDHLARVAETKRWFSPPALPRETP